jgi:hypothetical protein
MIECWSRGGGGGYSRFISQVIGEAYHITKIERFHMSKQEATKPDYAVRPAWLGSEGDGKLYFVEAEDRTPKAQPSDNLSKYKNKLFTADYKNARMAGKTLLNDKRFNYGIEKNKIISLLGSPDYKTFDNNQFCYKTNAGPLWFSFHQERLIKKAIVRPPRWRGTEEDLEKLWKKKKNTDDWYAW